MIGAHPDAGVTFAHRLNGLDEVGNAILVTIRGCDHRVLDSGRDRIEVDRGRRGSIHDQRHARPGARVVEAKEFVDVVVPREDRIVDVKHCFELTIEDRVGLAVAVDVAGVHAEEPVPRAARHVDRKDDRLVVVAEVARAVLIQIEPLRATDLGGRGVAEIDVRGGHGIEVAGVADPDILVTTRRVVRRDIAAHLVNLCVPLLPREVRIPAQPHRPRTVVFVVDVVRRGAVVGQRASIPIAGDLLLERELLQRAQRGEHVIRGDDLTDLVGAGGQPLERVTPRLVDVGRPRVISGRDRFGFVRIPLAVVVEVDVDLDPGQSRLQEGSRSGPLQTAERVNELVARAEDHRLRIELLQRRQRRAGARTKRTKIDAAAAERRRLGDTVITGSAVRQEDHVCLTARRVERRHGLQRLTKRRPVLRPCADGDSALHTTDDDGAEQLLDVGHVVLVAVGVGGHDRRPADERNRRRGGAKDHDTHP